MKYRLTRVWFLLASLWLMMPLSAAAQIDCKALPKWIKLDEKLSLNQKHVFCGEWHKDHPKGFHARPDGMNPTTVAHMSIQSNPNAAGVYTGRWIYKNHPEKEKFSSMFPDRCTMTQILNSIRHAVMHVGECPSGSPDWVRCGYNKPDTNSDSARYCSVDQTRFIIGFAPPQRGKVNTAFPLFE